MIELIHELWFLKRDLVSDDYDRALYRLAEEVAGMTIHEYPTGEPCWTWRVPEKWTCQRSLPGNAGWAPAARLPPTIRCTSSPTRCRSKAWSAGRSCCDHLHVHPRLPEAIPFVFKYYERDWGLCASQELRDALDEEAYRVVIRTRFEPGTLKVGEVVIPGESEESFVLVAHLCHPAMVNDDLSGVVVGLEVARAPAGRSEAAITPTAC